MRVFTGYSVAGRRQNKLYGFAAGGSNPRLHNASAAGRLKQRMSSLQSCCWLLQCRLLQLRYWRCKQRDADVNTQQTQNSCITFVQFWSNVKDVGPTLHKCYPNIMCLLGSCSTVDSHQAERLVYWAMSDATPTLNVQVFGVLAIQPHTGDWSGTCAVIYK